MGLSLSEVKPRPRDVFGSKRAAFVDVTFDSSYARGGEALRPALLGMSEITQVIQRPDGPIVAFDATNEKLKVLAQRSPVGVTLHCEDDDLAATHGVALYVHVPNKTNKDQVTIPVNLATVADGDVLTSLPIPYNFRIESVDAYVTNEVTTGAKTTTLNVEIGTINLTGGVLTVDSTTAATLGAKIAGTAVTANNTGIAGAAISIEAASTTAHAEGQIVVVIVVTNTDELSDLARATGEKAPVIGWLEFVSPTNANGEIPLSNGDAILVYDDDAAATDGVQLYNDEDEAVVSPLQANFATLARDVLVRTVGGNYALISYDASAAGNGVAVYFDEDGATGNIVEFVSPTDTDSEVNVDPELMPAADLAGTVTRLLVLGH